MATLTAFPCTMSRMIKEKTQRVLGYLLVPSFICLFACTSHSFLCYALLALHTHSAALFFSLAYSLTCSQAHRKKAIVHVMNSSISYNFNPLCIATAISLMWPKQMLVRMIFRCSSVDLMFETPSRIPIKGCVCPSIRLSVRPSFMSCTSRIFKCKFLAELMKSCFFSELGGGRGSEVSKSPERI